MHPLLLFLLFLLAIPVLTVVVIFLVVQVQLRREHRACPACRREQAAILTFEDTLCGYHRLRRARLERLEREILGD